jgi:outer membrane protein OmpA-like peptidoglycan-associated protein
MQKNTLTPSVLLIALVLGACSTAPTSTGLLEQTRIDYRNAQNDPQVAHYAAEEMKRAGDAMGQANSAASTHESTEKIDKLAYLAKQKIALSEEVAKQKSAEAEIANAGSERDRVLLKQRTFEADQAKLLAREAQTHSALLEAQLRELAARQTERGMVITLGDVLFGTDLARLNPEGIRTAQKLAVVLEQNPQRTVLIEGFTDSTGSAAHNQDLSERRATAVLNALHEMGVPYDRIALQAYGEGFPVAANDSAAHRQLNRRVEIVISNENGKIPRR